MFNPLSDKRGLTVVELLVSLTLLCVILGLGYNFYASSLNAFQEGEDTAVKQEKVNYAMAAITDQLRYAYELEITNPGDVPADAGDFFSEDDIYIFTVNGSVFQRFLDDQGDLQNTVIVNGGETPLGLDFSRVQGEGGGTLDDVLKVTVSENEGEYDVNTNIKLENMVAERNGIVNNSGNAVRYRRTTFDQIAADVSNPDAGNCICSTVATYGSDDAPQVNLLRVFRDRFLKTNRPGQAFVRLYYRYSPVLVPYIHQYDPLRLFLWSILVPVLGFVFLLTHKLLTLAVFGMIVTLGIRRNIHIPGRLGP